MSENNEKEFPTQKTITSAALIKAEEPFFSESPDALENTDIDLTVVSRYDPEFQDGNGWTGWVYEDWIVVSLSYWAAIDIRCVLSKEGQCCLYGPEGKPDVYSQIPEAGVFATTAIGLGYVNRIRAIGDQLYVCGQSRQIWRFEYDGKDLATGQWRDFAGDMRQPPMPELDEDLEDEALDAWLDEHDNAIDFLDIHGSANDDIYAVGDETWHWDGESWQQLHLPTDEPIAAIEVVSATQIYLVGHNGTVLAGNALDGFTDISDIDDNQNFIGVAWFKDSLYLAAPEGLYRYNQDTKQIERYETGLVPELQDAHMLEAKDGVMWSFGFKDLAWFDGQQWTRLDHPDNPPIR